MTDIEYLYKYRSVTDREIDWVEETITNNTVRFGSVAEFNDPFDSAPIYELKGSQDQVQRHLSDLIKLNSPEMPRSQRKLIARSASHPDESKKYITRVGSEMRRIIENIGVYCLSGTPDHILMWAHYADSHKGICFKFKASSTTPFFGRAQRVQYSRERPVVDRLNNTEDELTTNALLTKADYWSYEHEWRIVDYNDKPGIRTFPAQLLQGVILGARIDEVAEQRIRACIASRAEPVEILKASLDSRNFRLNITPAP